MFDLILSGVYKLIFGATKSPINEDFKKFSVKWNCLNPVEKFRLLDVRNREMKSKAKNAVDFLVSLLSSGHTFPRDDYKEVTELSLILLGVKAPQNSK